MWSHATRCSHPAKNPHASPPSLPSFPPPGATPRPILTCPTSRCLAMAKLDRHHRYLHRRDSRPILRGNLSLSRWPARLLQTRIPNGKRQRVRLECLLRPAPRDQPARRPAGRTEAALSPPRPAAAWALRREHREHHRRRMAHSHLALERVSVRPSPHLVSDIHQETYHYRPVFRRKGTGRTYYPQCKLLSRRPRYRSNAPSGESPPKASNGRALAEYPVTVSNCTSQPEAVALSFVRYGWEVMDAAVEPATLQLAPGESKPCTVSVHSPGPRAARRP